MRRGGEKVRMGEGVEPKNPEVRGWRVGVRGGGSTKGGLVHL